MPSSVARLPAHVTRRSVPTRTDDGRGARYQLAPGIPSVRWSRPRPDAVRPPSVRTGGAP